MGKSQQPATKNRPSEDGESSSPKDGRMVKIPVFGCLDGRIRIISCNRHIYIYVYIYIYHQENEDVLLMRVDGHFNGGVGLAQRVWRSFVRLGGTRSAPFVDKW